MLDLNDVPSLAGHALRAVGLLIRAKREGMRLYINDQGTVILEVNKADPSMVGPPEWIVDCGIPEEHLKLAIQEWEKTPPNEGSMRLIEQMCAPVAAKGGN